MEGEEARKAWLHSRFGGGESHSRHCYTVYQRARVTARVSVHVFWKFVVSENEEKKGCDQDKEKRRKEFRCTHSQFVCYSVCTCECN